MNVITAPSKITEVPTTTRRKGGGMVRKRTRTAAVEDGGTLSEKVRKRTRTAAVQDGGTLSEKEVLVSLVRI